MLPDPDLDVRFAASAWGFTLKAACFDRDAFASRAEHFGDKHIVDGCVRLCHAPADHDTLAQCQAVCFHCAMAVEGGRKFACGGGLGKKPGLGRREAVTLHEHLGEDF